MAGTFAARRTHGASRRARAGAAANAGVYRKRPTEPKRRADDRFFDVVVLICVVLFMLLATGVGILALQSSLH